MLCTTLKDIKLTLFFTVFVDIIRSRI